MIRGLLKLIVVVVVVVAAAAFFFGWRLGDGRIGSESGPPSVGTSGSPSTPAGDPADTAADRGRRVGAEVGERAGEAASAAQRAAADGSLTAKIKAKMSLDDMVKALNIDVDTAGGVVTLSGTVRSETERQRAVQLARETDGVRQVVDHLKVR